MNHLSSSASADAIEKKLKAIVSQVLAVSLRDVDPALPLTLLGMDSLASVDLVGQLKEQFGLELTQLEILGGMSTDEILRRALRKECLEFSSSPKLILETSAHRIGEDEGSRTGCCERKSTSSAMFSAEVLGTKPASFETKKTAFIPTEGFIGVGPRSSRPVDVGIVGMEAYFGSARLPVTTLEQMHGKPGKYTHGLSQRFLAVFRHDEDAVSMALTAVAALMDRMGIGYDRIGRMDVGSESAVDLSKSIKSYLMALFEENGNFDVEGSDCVHACYGGTAALFNTVAWMQSDAWDGRLGLVVATDIAMFEEHQSFLDGGAAVAMLIGPDAPVVLDAVRSSYSKNTFDFFKPVGSHRPFPIMGGTESMNCYTDALTKSCRSFCKKAGLRACELPAAFDAFLFHCTSVNMALRATSALSTLINSDSDLAPGSDAAAPCRRADADSLFRSHVEVGTRCTAHTGSSFTASVYSSLLSVLSSLAGRPNGAAPPSHPNPPSPAAPLSKLHRRSDSDLRLLLFSYGSGVASTLFSLSVRTPLPASFLPTPPPLLHSRRLASLPDYLHRRALACSPGHLDALTSVLASSGSDSESDQNVEDEGPLRRSAGVFYLDSVDLDGRRAYARAPGRRRPESHAH